MVSRGELSEEAFLEGDTLVVPSGDYRIAFSPFTGAIARLPPNMDFSAQAIALRGRGLFNPPPSPSPWSGPFTSLALFLTRACNLRCEYCYASAGDALGSMTWDTAKLALDCFSQQAPTRDSLRLCFHGGGEQTLEWQLMRKILDYCEKLGFERIQPLLTTNGVVSERVVEFLVRKAFHVTVSLDGPPEIQDAQRPLKGGRPSSPLVEQTVRRLVDANANLSVRPTITPETAPKILSVMEYFKRLGVSRVLLQPVFPSGRAGGTVFDEPGIRPNVKTLVDAFLQALDFAKANGMRISNSSYDSLLTGKAGSYCGAAGGRTMTVTHEGDISACYEVVDRTSTAASVFIIGRLDPTTRTPLMDPTKSMAIRERATGRIEKCRSCFARYVCAGGCPEKAYLATNDLLGIDEYSCQFARTIVPEIVRRVAEATFV